MPRLYSKRSLGSTNLSQCLFLQNKPFNKTVLSVTYSNDKGYKQVQGILFYIVNRVSWTMVLHLLWSKNQGRDPNNPAPAVLLASAPPVLFPPPPLHPVWSMCEHTDPPLPQKCTSRKMSSALPPPHFCSDNNSSLPRSAVTFSCS